MNSAKFILTNNKNKLSLYGKYKISKELTAGRMLSFTKIKQQIIRDPEFFFRNFRPQTKIKLTKILKPLEPLKFKLNEDFKEDYYYKQPSDIKTNTTFKIQRSHNNNLPVYSEYKQRHQIKKTIIKNVSGNIDDLVAMDINKRTTKKTHERA